MGKVNPVDNGKLHAVILLCYHLHSFGSESSEKNANNKLGIMACKIIHFSENKSDINTGI